VAEPTQVVPAQPAAPAPADDSTQLLVDVLPGFGPAGEDPPRQ
jgi:hypothetical protein